MNILLVPLILLFLIVLADHLSREQTCPNCGSRRLVCDVAITGPQEHEVAYSLLSRDGERRDYLSAVSTPKAVATKCRRCGCESMSHYWKEKWEIRH
jgi:hypothetical protein